MLLEDLDIAWLQNLDQNARLFNIYILHTHMGKKK